MSRATFFTAVLLLLVSAVLWGVSQASDEGKSLQDCCLSTSSKEIPSRIVKDYTIQWPGNGCKIHAVLFLTKNKKHLCAPPQLKWVRKLMAKVNGKKSKTRPGKKSRKSQKKRKRLP
ncbi:C-C motif chemokine 19-like [Heptranchias perlo]|uniref:C-C motif chemokine 19-like n=1 Tax=Heptranchias perlo TaxID=212740 RepID=UPI00355A4E9E